VRSRNEQILGLQQFQTPEVAVSSGAPDGACVVLETVHCRDSRWREECKGRDLRKSGAGRIQSVARMWLSKEPNEKSFRRLKSLLRLARRMPV
jgi:hypothetical protein